MTTTMRCECGRFIDAETVAEYQQKDHSFYIDGNEPTTVREFSNYLKLAGLTEISNVLDATADKVDELVAQLPPEDEPIGTKILAFFSKPEPEEEPLESDPNDLWVA